MAELTARAAAFVSGLAYRDLPAEANGIVGRGLADCIGVMILGYGEPVARIVAGVETSAEHESATFWNRSRARADVAALVNGTAAHALDFDDTGLEGHPSAVLVPAALALGEAVGADGKQIVTAYVAGFEVWADLAARDKDRFHAKGIHPTATFGAIAAAAVASLLLRLDAERTGAALSIAASMAAGVMANFGTMTKPFQVGRAAQSGVLAARLAASGMTAAKDGLENALGFLRAFSPAGRVDVDREPVFGRRWAILERGLSFKLNPACYAAHRIIDSTGAIAAAHRIDPADVAAIDIDLGHTQAIMLRSREPQNALDARFSAEFVVASALSRGAVGLAEFSDDFVTSAGIQSLMRTVRRVITEDSDADNPGFSPADRVTVHLRDGRSIAGPRVSHARGHMRNPVDLDVLRAKFEECTRGTIGAGEADALFARLVRPDRLRSVAEIYSQAAPA